MWHETNPQQDRELVERCQAGDDTAFEFLVRKYQRDLFGLIYRTIGARAEAEDILQKVFAKMYFALPRFDVRRPFYPWIRRIAVNQCYDELRKARRRRTLTFTELNLQDSRIVEDLLREEAPGPALQEGQEALHELLRRLLDHLPEKQRMALVMRDLEQAPYGNIARSLNCTEQAARLKVFRARMRLRTLMMRALKRRELSRAQAASPLPKMLASGPVPAITG